MKKIILILFILPLFSFSQWEQIGQDIDGEFVSEYSGTSVSLSGDGSIVAIGAPQNRGIGTDYYHMAGNVRVYNRNGDFWTQIGNDIDGIYTQEESGRKISLSNDGSTLAVCSNYSQGNSSNISFIRIYKNIGNTWTQIGGNIYRNYYSDPISSVSLNNDGTVLAVGAHENDDNGGNAGQVCVYKFSVNSWIQIGNNINGNSGYYYDSNTNCPSVDYLGGTVSLNGDGTILIAGARYNSNSSGYKAGCARVYKNIKNNWVQIGESINGERELDYSGHSVSINNSGTIVAIGSDMNSDNGTQSGHVRIFENINNVWTQLGGDIDGKNPYDRSGATLDLNSEGTTVAIGSPWGHGNGNYSGRTRVYSFSSNTWEQSGMDIIGEDATNYSGESVSLSNDGSVVAIGASGNDGNGVNSGHVRVYSNNVLSIEDNTFGSEFLVYPNPSYGLASINLNKNYKQINLAIFDSVGKKIATSNYRNIDKISIDTNTFASGIYILNIKSERIQTNIKLVVK